MKASSSSGEPDASGVLRLRYAPLRMTDDFGGMEERR